MYIAVRTTQSFKSGVLISRVALPRLNRAWHHELPEDGEVSAYSYASSQQGCSLFSIGLQTQRTAYVTVLPVRLINTALLGLGSQACRFVLVPGELSRWSAAGLNICSS
jgi:hypothetical protein